MKKVKTKCLLLSLLIAISLPLLAGCQLLPPINLPTISPPTKAPPAETPAPISPDWKLPLAQSPSTPLPSIADVVAKVKPAVVAINTETVSYFFNQPFTQEGAGSGWIVDSSGIIVTNNHVVEGAKTVTVTLSDGQVFTVENIRTDPLNDLAILKINAGPLPAATIGNSAKLRVGDWVVAIGNPLGLGISAKEGIVSRLGVPVSVSSGQTLYDLIETSAAINPGNSGGPLVNMAGEVVGITSAKIAQVGVEGLGYAININTAAPIVEQLVRIGYVAWPWLGVSLMTVDQGVAARSQLSVNKGALVTSVEANSPAGREAKLQAGDVIVGFNDHEIASADDVIQAIRSSRIGDRVRITYWRGNSETTTFATLAERPS